MVNLTKITLGIALLTLIIVVASLIFNKGKQVENGYASKPCWPPGKCNLSKGTGGRAEIIPVVLKKPFSSPPKVTTSVRLMETNSPATNIRYNAWAENVTTEGCDIKIDTWGDTIIYTFGVSWIAVEE